MELSEIGDSCEPLVTRGYDCDFVQEPPNSLQCPQCLLPFRDPVLLNCCGYKGCASCIGRIKAAGHPCSNCQQPFDTMLEKELQRKVLDLRVYCSKKKEGCGWQGELRDLETHLREDCGYVIHEMDSCPKHPPEVVTQSLKRKMDERVDELERVHEEDQAKIIALQGDLRDVHAKYANLNQLFQDLQRKFTSSQGPWWQMDPEGTLSSPYPPCSIVMPHFSQHKAASDAWYSLPFYSKPGGYKLCLNVDADGSGEGSHTHISVYVYLMKGDHDDNLQWPFEHVVTFRILNWKEDKHHVKFTLNFEESAEESKAQVTTSERASSGWGLPLLLTHNELYSNRDEHIQYLEKDKLCIEVLSVEPPK